jgi:hypothetical protein
VPNFSLSMPQPSTSAQNRPSAAASRAFILICTSLVAMPQILKAAVTWAAATRRMLEQALALVDLADPAESSAEGEPL